MTRDDARTCDTCRHTLGGGCCRINLEAECGKGEFEAWEPREGSADNGNKDGKEMASARMVNGLREFTAGFCDYIKIAFEEFAMSISSINWDALARLKEQDPDLFNWMATGPIRRVQLRRARALMEGKGKWRNYTRR